MEKIEIEIVRDVWVDNAETGDVDRLRAGARMTVDLTEQIWSGIESGAVRRVKPDEKKAKK